MAPTTDEIIADRPATQGARRAEPTEHHPTVHPVDPRPARPRPDPRRVHRGTRRGRERSVAEAALRGTRSGSCVTQDMGSVSPTLSDNHGPAGTSRPADVRSGAGERPGVATRGEGRTFGAHHGVLHGEPAERPGRCSLPGTGTWGVGGGVGERHPDEPRRPRRADSTRGSREPRGSGGHQPDAWGSIPHHASIC